MNYEEQLRALGGLYSQAPGYTPPANPITTGPYTPVVTPTGDAMARGLAALGKYRPQAVMEPDLQTTQRGGYAPDQLPLGARTNSDGQAVTEEGYPWPVTRRPGVLPFTRDAVSGDLTMAMPKAADIVANALPSAAGAAVAPLRLAEGEIALGSGPIRAYHGSPHDFYRFSLDRVGTGEGGQSYGHGLYFAGNEDVAKGYRDILSRDGNPGHMYEVNIHADPKQLLDLDAPAAQQSPLVLDALRKTRIEPEALGGGVPTGHDVQRLLQNHFMEEAAPTYEALMKTPLSDLLNHSTQRMIDHGIVGNRYLDGGSRTAGDGSRNYVVFNDQLIDILRKYGLAGMALLPPAYGALQNQSGQQGPSL